MDFRLYSPRPVGRSRSPMLDGIGAPARYGRARFPSPIGCIATSPKLEACGEWRCFSDVLWRVRCGTWGLVRPYRNIARRWFAILTVGFSSR